VKRSFQQHGFTLVELLVASTIMVLILSSLGSLFVSTNRAYRKNDEVSEQQQSIDTAVQLLSYDIGLAGYKGSTSASSSRKFKTLALVDTSTLTIIKGASATDSDRIVVRYFEDRFADGNEQLVVTLDAIPSGTDRNLYRRQEKQSDIDTLAGYTPPNRRPTVANVHNLKVISYIRKDGTEGNTATKDTLAALKIELTFGYDAKELKRQLVIGIKNEQNVPVLPTL
jgi:prepilin-type N-terminal cleavage/methylation domain-containing protein